MAHLDEVILQRAYDVETREGASREIAVRIGRPTRDLAEGGDWKCGYIVDGLGRDISGVAYGVDSLQALLLCLRRIAAELDHVSRELNATLTWLGMEDLGLPK